MLFISENLGSWNPCFQCCMTDLHWQQSALWRALCTTCLSRSRNRATLGCLEGKPSFRAPRSLHSSSNFFPKRSAKTHIDTCWTTRRNMLKGSVMSGKVQVIKKVQKLHIHAGAAVLWLYRKQIVLIGSWRAKYVVYICLNNMTAQTSPLIQLPNYPLTRSRFKRANFCQYWIISWLFPRTIAEIFHFLNQPSQLGSWLSLKMITI